MKTSAELKTAQAAVNRMQYIIKSVLIFLLKPRQGYTLSKIGILEAYVPAHKIEVLAGTTTLASIVISGLEYLKLHRVPSLSQNRLLGRCQFLKCNEDGMLHNFTDVSKLNSQIQDEKLENYNLAIRRTVADFLVHFSGSETFHLRPDVVIQLGAPTTALQSAMSKCGHQIEGYSHTGWRIRETMEKLQEQEYQDVAETALADFDKLIGPVEIRAAVLKSTGLHIKDLLGSASHVSNASLPIRHPCEVDLESWVGWNPALIETLKEMAILGKEDKDESQQRLDRIDETLTKILQKLRRLEVSESLRDEKENQLLKGFKDFMAAKSKAEK